MWIDSVIEYDIIVETLTGAEIEVTVTDDDTIGYIKTHIQKYEGNCKLFFSFIDAVSFVQSNLAKDLVVVKFFF